MPYASLPHKSVSPSSMPSARVTSSMKPSLIVQEAPLPLLPDFHSSLTPETANVKAAEVSIGFASSKVVSFKSASRNGKNEKSIA